MSKLLVEVITFSVLVHSAVSGQLIRGRGRPEELISAFVLSDLLVLGTHIVNVAALVRGVFSRRRHVFVDLCHA